MSGYGTYVIGQDAARDELVRRALGRLSTGHCNLREATEINAAGWPDGRRWGVVGGVLTEHELHYAWERGQAVFYGRD